METKLKPAIVEFGKDKYHLNDSMRDWCYKNLGAGGWVWANPDDWEIRHWAVFTMFGNTTFYFKHEQDAMLFVLSWK